MKVRATVELEMAEVGSKLDAWAWALERQIEGLDFVEKAAVLTVVEQVPPLTLWDDEPPQDRLEVHE